MSSSTESATDSPAALPSPRDNNKRAASKRNVVLLPPTVTVTTNSTSPTTTTKLKTKRTAAPSWKPHTQPSTASGSSANNAHDDDAHNDDDDDENDDVWDISRINKHWEIDKELKRSLPFLARAKRSDKETASDKFLRLSKIPLPAAAQCETMLMDIAAPSRQPSQRTVVSMTPETKAKYFGVGARHECHAIFRKLAAQKYLTDTPVHQFLTEQQQREDEQRLLLGSRSATPATPATQATESGGNSSSSADLLAPISVPPISRLKSSSSQKSTSSSLQTTSSYDRRGLFTRQFTARHKFASLCLEKDLPPCIRLIMRNYFSPEINISHMAIGDELAMVFAACLVDLPMVTGLNARNNRLGDRGLQAIIDVVVAKKDLFHLDLSENKVDGHAAASLAAYLAAPKCALQSLKIAHADVDDGELAPFARALHTNKSLQPSIVTGGEALATMLSINYTLTFLDLSWNYLRLGGAVELGKSLAYNNGIRELNLAYNALGNAGAQAVGEALLSNTTLARLNLSNNNIPAQGAQAIASALKVNSAMLWLNLDGNPLGQTGGRSLLHAVAACTDRQLHVCMDGCNFDLSESDAFDPSESTGTYELNMAIPYERAIALELLRVANTKQGCKFLSILHSSAATPKLKRQIKVELREADTTDARRRLLKTAGILTDASGADEEQLKLFQLDRASLATLFQELDQDNSGFIDESELKKGMQMLGLIASHALRDEDIARSIAQYDLDGTGTIELDEFVELMGSFDLESSADQHVARQVYDVETDQPFEIPTEGTLRIEFVDFHVSADTDNAHSHAGVERLIENISNSKNKSQMLEMAKSGLYFRAPEAQLLLDSVCDVFEITQAVSMLLPNMVDPKSAYQLIDNNLSTAQRVRLQHLMGAALQPMLGLGTGHYRIDLGTDLDRLTLKKLVENSNRTAFLRRKQGLKDTSQHGNYHGFRNELLNGKPLVLEPTFLDTMPKFGMLEFDYTQLGRSPPHSGKAMSNKRFEQLLKNLQLAQMAPSCLSLREAPGLGGGRRVSTTTSTRTISPLSSSSSSSSPSLSGSRGSPTKNTPVTRSGSTSFRFVPTVPNTPALFAELDKMKNVKNYIKFGDGLNHVAEIKPVVIPSGGSCVEQAREEEGGDDDENGEDDDKEERAERSQEDTQDNKDIPLVITRNGKETTTAKRLLFNLQWYMATRWLSSRQAVQLLSLWPRALEATRVDVVSVVFDRLVDLHNFFNAVLSVLSEFEAAQCLYRLGWLNVWCPLNVDNYYELHLAQYEEREIAKVLVRLAIDEPGENWQRETFGWSREELIPGWELNLSWLKDGGFPEKGYLCLEYYSGADKGCGPVWPTRRELASSTLCGLPHDDELQRIELYVDSLCMMKRTRSPPAVAAAASEIPSVP